MCWFPSYSLLLINETVFILFLYFYIEKHSSIGLAKKLVHIFPDDGTEKPK